MQRHWADTPSIEDFIGEGASRPDPESDNEPQLYSDLAESNFGGRVPFLMLRGRWLRQMGMGIGSKLKVQASQGRIIIDLIGPAPAPVPNVPTVLEREVHYTDVLPHTHVHLKKGCRS